MMIARSSDMAAKKIVSGSEEFQMFQDFWKICQEFWIPEDSDEYWENLKNRTDEFYKKYGTPYAMGLALGFVMGVEKAWKEGKKK